ncbi:6-phosphogluconolactonase [Flavobacteriaceae bacterium F89]|uniref:6-phosphogluconolactonase n=1 Tax=Cerina litoralis TaxID=2874477 RepID=A0AAE3JQZ4_9FLAO|nr:6-phosphogluconolactonase [Cerina litoralis]MCG2460768.1 6-phosphogluconolactonase [Cerina litoralis]
MKLNISESKLDVAQNFAKYLQGLVANRSEVHIALSGGSTPKIVFDELATEYHDSINWDRVHLYWGDERCVPPNDSESNYKMTVDHLLSKIDIPEGNVHRIYGENLPKEEAIRYSEVLESRLPHFDGVPQFDLVILGMGDDGHTASVFPYNIHLWDSGNLCEVAVHPDSGQKRITITGKVINNAKKVAFLVTGVGKMEKVREIVNRKGNFGSYPAALVDPKSGDLDWFLDGAAARGL